MQAGRLEPLRQTILVVAGAAVALTPSLIAVIGLLAPRLGRWRWPVAPKSIALWILAAAFLSTPLLVTSGVGDAGLAFLQILAALGTLSLAASIRRRLPTNLSLTASVGPVLGLAIFVAIGLSNTPHYLTSISSFPFARVDWTGHGSAIGAGAIVMSSLLSLVIPSPVFGLVALFLGAAGALLLGSVFTVLSWLFIAVGFRFVGRRGTRFTKRAEWFLIGIVALLMFTTSLLGTNTPSVPLPVGPTAEATDTVHYNDSNRTQTHSPLNRASSSQANLNLRQTHFPTWRIALEAVNAKPLFGWGISGSVTDRASSNEAAFSRAERFDSRNLLLQVWVERGAFGALGVVLVFVLLSLRAVQQRDRTAVVVLTGVIFLNIFDANLLSGPVLYPLAAVLGWRAVGRREYAQAETGPGSALLVRLGLALSDLAVGIGSLSIAIYFAGRFDPNVSLGSSWSLPLAYATMAWPAIAAVSRLYPGYGMPSYRELSVGVRAGAAAAVLVGFITLLAPEVFHLTAPVFLVAVPASMVLAPLFRLAAKRLLSDLRLWGRAVVILGTEPTAERVTRHLLNHPGIGLHPVAVFGSSPSWGLQQLPIAGGLEKAWDYVKLYRINHAIVTTEAASAAAFDDVLLQIGSHLRYVQYLPDLRGMPTNTVVATPLGTSLALEAQNQLASRTNRVIKRAWDVVGSTLLLALLGLPLLLIAMVIRAESTGPALYRSPRIGRDGKTFDCIKFRSMHVDAEERLEKLLEANPDLQQEYQRYHKLTRDPRTTRVGRLLRRASLDELPQLLNVLIGHMSLVGPRPYMITEYDLMGPERDLIFLARPGITGYWQVEARNDVSFEERQTMEAHYVRNWTMWWDIDIMVRTPAVMLGRTGK